MLPRRMRIHYATALTMVEGCSGMVERDSAVVEAGSDVVDGGSDVVEGMLAEVEVDSGEVGRFWCTGRVGYDGLRFCCTREMFG